MPVENCFRQFGESFNRVKYFSCISSNIKESHLPIEWFIENPNGITYGMEKPDNLDYMIKGFQYFLQRYLVRDCIESFALSLDDLFLTLMINGKRLELNKTLLGNLSKEERIKLNFFQEAGLFSKIEKLESTFGLIINRDNKKVITSLKDIRNCFAHSNGIVRNTDGSKVGKDTRCFKWKYFHVFLQGVDTGKKMPLVIGEELQEASNVCFEISEYVKHYKIGEPMSFTSKETFEIAYSLQLIGINIIEVLKEKLAAALDSSQKVAV